MLATPSGLGHQVLTDADRPLDRTVALPSILRGVVSERHFRGRSPRLAFWPATPVLGVQVLDQVGLFRRSRVSLLCGLMRQRRRYLRTRRRNPLLDMSVSSIRQ